jgi:hypothetical protein
MRTPPSAPSLAACLALAALVGCTEEEPRSRYSAGGVSGNSLGGGSFVGRDDGVDLGDGLNVDVGLGEMVISGAFQGDVSGRGPVDHHFDGACTNIIGDVMNDVVVVDDDDGDNDNVAVGVYLHLMPPLRDLPDDAVIEHAPGDTSGTFVIVSRGEALSGHMAERATITISRSVEGHRLVRVAASGDDMDVVADTRILGDEAMP